MLFPLWVVRVFECAPNRKLGSCRLRSRRRSKATIDEGHVNELPRRKQRGINSLNLHSFRGKPRGIEPEEIQCKAEVCAQQGSKFPPFERLRTF